MYLNTLLTALVILAWALSRDEGLVSQAVEKTAGWCRDNLGCSEQPHGAKNGKCDQSFVAEGTESRADFSQQCEAQRFPPALLPMMATWKKTKQCPGEQQPLSPRSCPVSSLKDGDDVKQRHSLLSSPVPTQTVL